MTFSELFTNFLKEEKLLNEGGEFRTWDNKPRMIRRNSSNLASKLYSEVVRAKREDTGIISDECCIIFCTENMISVVGGVDSIHGIESKLEYMDERASTSDFPTLPTPQQKK